MRTECDGECEREYEHEYWEEDWRASTEASWTMLIDAFGNRKNSGGRVRCYRS